MSAKTDTKKSSKKAGDSFTDEEKAAMKERAKELKAEAKASKSREEGEKAVFDAIEQMAGSDRFLAQRLHEIITETAPELDAQNLVWDARLC
ncbi:MAG: hypothetical protein V9G20_23435 [Candidatus Promineifilaceae bacterium]